MAHRHLTNQINCLPNFNKNLKTSKTHFEKQFLSSTFSFPEQIFFKNAENCFGYRNSFNDDLQYENIPIDLIRVNNFNNKFLIKVFRILIMKI